MSLSYDRTDDCMVFCMVLFSDAPIWLKTDIPIFYHRYLPIPITDPIFYI